MRSTAERGPVLLDSSGFHTYNSEWILYQLAGTPCFAQAKFSFCYGVANGCTMFGNGFELFIEGTHCSRDLLLLFDGGMHYLTGVTQTSPSDLCHAS